MAHFSRSELRGAKLHHLLVLTVGGRDYRFATSSLEVDNADGNPNPLLFLAGLEELEYTDEAKFGGSLPERKVGISVRFRKDNASGWAAVANTQHDVGEMTAELSLWREGDDFNRRRVLLKGAALEPAHGDIFEPLDFTLVENHHDDRGLLPPTNAVATVSAWPTGVTYKIDERVIGTPYPQIVGSPGNVPTDADYTESVGSPGLIVEIHKTDLDNSVSACTILVAGHETFAGHTSASVRVHNLSAATPWSATQTVIHTPDTHGRMISAVQFTHAAGATLVEEGDEIWIEWILPDGGMPNHAHPIRALRGAGELIRELMGHTSLRFDLFRSWDALRHVDAFEFDFYWNEHRAPWDVITEDILPYIPAVPLLGPAGIYFRIWNLKATAADAVAHIDVDTWGGFRTQEVVSSPATDVFNEITLEYALRVDSDQFLRRLTLGPSKVSSDDTTEVNPFCYASWTRYGRELRSMEPLQCDTVQDPSTAQAVLGYLALRHTQTRKATQFLLPQEYQALEPCDIVTVTDSSIGWTDEICIVTAVTRTPGDPLVDVETIPNWIRDTPLATGVVLDDFLEATTGEDDIVGYWSTRDLATGGLGIGATVLEDISGQGEPDVFRAGISASGHWAVIDTDPPADPATFNHQLESTWQSSKYALMNGTPITNPFTPLSGMILFRSPTGGPSSPYISSIFELSDNSVVDWGVYMANAEFAVYGSGGAVSGSKLDNVAHSNPTAWCSLAWRLTGSGPTWSLEWIISTVGGTFGDLVDSTATLSTNNNRRRFAIGFQATGAGGGYHSMVYDAIPLWSGAGDRDRLETFHNSIEAAI